ncbi:MAG: response regulator, partial [Thermanaerothrix sp.]|nr:response regulator [Thermanaerothrix sp.]
DVYKRQLLELEGYLVITPSSPDPQKISAIIQQEHPALVILDAHLQEVSGVEILSHLRGSSLNFQPKIILTSGEDLGVESYKAGADAFLLKPFAPEKLLHMIKSLTIPQGS